VVKDTDRTIAYYSGTLGLPPFRTNSFPCTQATYNGRRIDTAFKASFTEIGDCRLELMEVVEGDTPHSRFLAERGEGMHHLRFEVDDLEGRLNALAGKGVATTWRAPEAGLAYLDTTGTGGMVFALSQRN
jgi:catechol 2,3-dioxygenase-like lactoylglutathione lyase family enzyme